VRTKTPQQADKILDAAARLFGTHRFHEVRMEDIAAAAGTGKGTLYRYFRDKEELYLALLTRLADQFLHRVEAVAAGPGSARQRLEQLAAVVIDYFDGQPHLLDLILRAEVRSEQGRAFPWQKTREELPKLVERLFRQGEERGEFRITDPAVSVFMYLGGLRSLIRFGERPRPRDLAGRIVTGLLEGAGAHLTGYNGHERSHPVVAPIPANPPRR
jgi:AcrR family transcriptional regulator